MHGQKFIGFVFVISVVVDGSTSFGQPIPDPRNSSQYSRIVSDLPLRLQPVSCASPWGEGKSAAFVVSIRNDTSEAWTEFKADGGCTCASVQLSSGPENRVKPGEKLILRVAYSEPKTASLQQRNVKLLLNGSVATMPVLVEWIPPLVLRSVQTNAERNGWVVQGAITGKRRLTSVDSFQEDVSVRAFRSDAERFTIELDSVANSTRFCSLRCITRSSQQQRRADVEQILQLTLQANVPRSVPSRISCQLDSAGRFQGKTRIVFPRNQGVPRPDLTDCSLVVNESEMYEATVSQTAIGSIAFAVSFRTKKPISRDRLRNESEIEFRFSDGSNMRCPFRLSQIRSE